MFRLRVEDHAQLLKDVYAPRTRARARVSLTNFFDGHLALDDQVR